jgi:pyrroloquinoline quinone biosynthesis protein D
MPRPDLQARPLLAAHVRLRTDPVSGDPVLLFPEGLLVLNATAHEIVKRCTGGLAIAELIGQLAEEFDGDDEIVREDVLENLAQLHRQNLIVYRV